MKAAAKIAISLPADTLRSLDRAARRLSLSRSAAVRRALDHWMRTEELDQQDRGYVEGYLAAPERDDAADAFGRAAVAGWGKWE